MTKRTRAELAAERAQHAGLYAVLDKAPFEGVQLEPVPSDSTPDDLRAEVERGEPEQLIRAEAMVELEFGSKNHGAGTLIVGTRKLYFWNDADKKGFSFDHKKIIMHALVTDAEQFGAPCIYCQLDTDGIDDHDDGEQEGEEGEDEPDFNEMRLIPKNTEILDAIYHALSLGSQINPDENMDDDDDEGMMFGGNMAALSAQGMATLAQLEASFSGFAGADFDDDDDDDDEQEGEFEDADEDGDAEDAMD